MSVGAIAAAALAVSLCAATADAQIPASMIAITADGHELLTPGLPYTAQEIEAAMSTQPREATRLQALQARAAKFGSVISAPAFEITKAQLDATVKNAIRDGDLALDRIARQRRGDLTFASTVGALEEVRSEAANVVNRLTLIEQTSPTAALREGATPALKTLQAWLIGIDYDDDVYGAIQRYAAGKPRLSGEEARLLAMTLRDYRRAGLDLPKEARARVEQWRTRLDSLSTDFRNNITRAVSPVKFTRLELEGVPDNFLQQVKTGEDEYTVMANVTVQYVVVLENARREETRRRLEVARANLARDENVPLIEEMLILRHRIAKALGYATWADYATGVNMAKDGRTAVDFLQQLNAALRPTFVAQIEAFRQLKVRETGDANAVINMWDSRYYASLFRKERYDVDTEQLRAFFPYQRVLDGMLAIYQRIFHVTFARIDPPFTWDSNVELYAVSDAGSGEPLGLFYLDMFPREGKYNHFAAFPVIDGKRRSDGRYQRPVVALVCNFPSPSATTPSLLSHRDVETLFHEFGHAMHVILGRARFARFTGLNVPRDFVEAPSQMLEKWLSDKTVLDSFAADYRDPAKKIPADVLTRMKEARVATEASRYVRLMVGFGLMDLALHTRLDESNARDAVATANAVMAEVFLPWPADTAALASYGHFVGYDAGFYGYAWADAIAADLATVFEKAPDRYLDAAAGRRLRAEIYEPGDSRDVTLSIERFLGRPRSLEPLLRHLGIR